MIQEIDYNKYLVIKNDDLHQLSLDLQRQQSMINTQIRFNRMKQDKIEWNQYLVLNVEDEFNVQYLWSKLTDISIHTPVIKIKDIAVNLVNSILKVRK